MHRISVLNHFLIFNVTDPVGVLLSLFAASFSFVLLQAMLASMHLKADPFMIYVFLAQENFKKQVWIIQIARVIGSVFLSQWLLTSFRVFVPIYLGMTTIYLRFVKALKFRNAAYKSFQLYKQLIVQRNILRNFERDLTSVGLVGVFILLVLTTSASVIAFSEKNFTMLAVVALTFTIGYSTVSVTFHICCSINEDSVEILKRWESQCGSGTQAQFLRRILRSNKPLFVPVGEVGIMDKDLKLNYFSAVTDYAVNVLLAVQ